MNDANLGNLKVLCIGTEKNQKNFPNLDKQDYIIRYVFKNVLNFLLSLSE